MAETGLSSCFAIFFVFTRFNCCFIVYEIYVTKVFSRSRKLNLLDLGTHLCATPCHESQNLLTRCEPCGRRLENRSHSLRTCSESAPATCRPSNLVSGSLVTNWRTQSCCASASMPNH